MSPSSQILSCLLLLGWATATLAESEKTVQGAPRAPHQPRKELATFERNWSVRRKRATGAECPPGKEVTDEVAQDDLMPIDYTPDELRACLGDEILKKYLPTMSSYAFTEEQLPVMKEKLDEMYPTGYPDTVLISLGGLIGLMGPEDIKKWRFTSPTTLSSLLFNAPSDKMAAAIIRQYTNNGGLLNAEALNAIGTKSICLLDLDQLKKIDENAIRAANPLDPSDCNQTTKDILYPIAKRAFSNRHNSLLYYKRIRPYLGGAPGEDLRALSKDNVNMDIATFLKLSKDAVRELTPPQVKDLLGTNLRDLKKQENNPLVKAWIVRQKQSELDALGIELKGGTPEGYVNITPRNNGAPETSGAAGGPALHLFPSLLLTLLLAAFLS